MIYIASPFFKPEQVKVVEEIEALLDSLKQPYYSPRRDGVLSNMTKEQRLKEASRIYELNVTNIQKAEELIAVTDNFDPGTIFEMGYAAALGKKIITYSPLQYGMNVMLSQCTYAHATSINGLMAALGGVEFEDVIVPETVT